jgi:hypothetical protein
MSRLQRLMNGSTYVKKGIICEMGEALQYHEVIANFKLKVLSMPARESKVIANIQF